MKKEVTDLPEETMTLVDLSSLLIYLHDFWSHSWCEWNHIPSIKTVCALFEFTKHDNQIPTDVWSLRAELHENAENYPLTQESVQTFKWNSKQLLQNVRNLYSFLIWTNSSDYDQRNITMNSSLDNSWNPVVSFTFNITPLPSPCFFSTLSII